MSSCMQRVRAPDCVGCVDGGVSRRPTEGGSGGASEHGRAPRGADRHARERRRAAAAQPHERHEGSCRAPAYPNHKPLT
eukprot:9475296-Pyramimonas_sp.AAC.1